ncbi:MAG: spore coat protein GerQ [Bacilli bacterium]|jgi:spore germination protein Q
MNNGYYQSPIFPGSAMPSGTPNQQLAPTLEQKNANNNLSPYEQSYIENILRLNKGKVAKFYMSYPDSVEWRDKVFNGIIEAAGRDHIIISDPNTGLWHLLLIIYLDYVDFDEPINYNPAFGQIK